MNINNKEIEIDAEGYLVHPENWDKEVALVLAKSENITLTDAYWPIFDFMRVYYNEHGNVYHLKNSDNFLKFPAYTLVQFYTFFDHFRRLCVQSLY
jgi:TusE/DsrC/DsvC family sulfur relay protein